VGVVSHIQSVTLERGLLQKSQVLELKNVRSWLFFGTLWFWYWQLGSWFDCWDHWVYDVASYQTVGLSRCGTVSKRLNISLKFFH